MHTFCPAQLYGLLREWVGLRGDEQASGREHLDVRHGDRVRRVAQEAVQRAHREEEALAAQVEERMHLLANQFYDGIRSVGVLGKTTTGSEFVQP